jgi:beta-xylosidase
MPRRSGLRAAAMTLLALLVFSGCGGPGAPPGASTDDVAEGTTAASETFENPVYDANFPDPFVLEADETYYAYSTNDPPTNVPTLRSDDLVDWEEGEDAMPKLAAWARPGKTWAPEVLRPEDESDSYVLYYTATDADSGRQCLGRATSDAPEGPFVDRSEEPFVCQRTEGGSIDASPFRDENGELYLYWKNDGNAVGRDSYLYAQSLSPDGSSLEGEPERLFKQGADWEGELVEAPFMWERDGRHYLFYSANAYYDASYAVGYATCEAPLGPCEKAPENPILETSEGAAGPGHNSIVEDDEGDTWMAYHAWPPDAIGSVIPGRTFWMDELLWRDGKPVVEGPTEEAQPAPG